MTKAELEEYRRQLVALYDRLNGDVSHLADEALHTEGGELRLLKPVAWQESDGERREIICGYRINKANRVEFSVGDYDRGRALVIDPVLSYSTYLGGTSTETGLGIAVGKDGAAYITGSTLSLIGSAANPAGTSPPVQNSYSFFEKR